MTALSDFLAACDGFCAAPAERSRLSRMVTARMRLVDEWRVEDTRWADVVLVIAHLAEVAQQSAGSSMRRAAVAEIMALALRLWRADLGDGLMVAPKTPPAPIRQYKDE